MKTVNDLEKLLKEEIKEDTFIETKYVNLVEKLEKTVAAFAEVDKDSNLGVMFRKESHNTKVESMQIQLRNRDYVLLHIDTGNAYVKEKNNTEYRVENNPQTIKSYKDKDGEVVTLAANAEKYGEIVEDLFITHFIENQKQKKKDAILAPVMKKASKW